MEKLTSTISSSPVVIMSLVPTTPSQIIQQTNTLPSLFSPSFTPSPLLAPTIIINGNDISVDRDSKLSIDLLYVMVTVLSLYLSFSFSSFYQNDRVKCSVICHNQFDHHYAINFHYIIRYMLYT